MNRSRHETLQHRPTLHIRDGESFRLAECWISMGSSRIQLRKGDTESIVDIGSGMCVDVVANQSNFHAMKAACEAAVGSDISIECRRFIRRKHHRKTPIPNLTFWLKRVASVEQFKDDASNRHVLRLKFMQPIKGDNFGEMVMYHNCPSLL